LSLLCGVYGAGGFGREVISVAQEHLRTKYGPDCTLCFVDDVVSEPAVNGVRVMRYADFVADSATRKLFNIAVANAGHRAALAEKCLSNGMQPFSIVASTNITSPDSEIAEGAILCPYTIVTANSKIGRYFHANIFSYVAHDCLIGDFVTFAPGVKCNGHVIVEDRAFVATGAILGPGRSGAPLVVGQGATVGAGAVVMRDVPPGVTVLGNPARALPGRTG